MNIESYIRLLARNPYWQEVYRSSQKCSGIHLFENNTNISGLQYLFLYWLRVYDLLYTEMANNAWDNLDYAVIKDDDRCDAFLYWRKKEIDRQNHQHKKEQRKLKHKKGTRDFKIYKGGK